MDQRPSAVEEMLEPCMQYLDGAFPEGPFRIYHQSFREFLSKSSQYRLEPDDVRKDIAEYFWSEYVAFRDNGSPLDDYTLANLPMHLAEADRWNDLHELVAEGSADGQLWARARLAADGSYAGYLADLFRAWANAERNEEIGRGTARQIRYALITSSLRSIAANIPAELLKALVHFQMPGWSAGAALGYALEVPPEHRAEYLVALAPHLSVGLLETAMPDALAVALTLPDPWSRSSAIRGLAPYLPPKLAREALGVATSLVDPPLRNVTVAALALRLPAAEVRPLLVQALSDTQAIGDLQTGIAAVAALAPGLPADLQAEAIGQAMAKALTLPEETVRDDFMGRREFPRCITLSVLAPHLPPELRLQAIAAVQGVRDVGIRTAFLVQFLPWLPSNLLPQFVDGLRYLSKRFRFEMSGTYLDVDELVARAIVNLIPQLPDNLLHQTLSLALSIGRWEQRSVALAALAPRLPPDSRAKALTQALTDAQNMQHRPTRVLMLTTIAPALPPDQRRQALSQALTLTQTIGDPGGQAQALAALAPHLPDNLHGPALSTALDLARAVEWRDDPQETLAAIAPCLPLDLMADCLAAACAIDRTDQRGQALASLAHYLPSELLGQAWEAAVAIQVAADRLQAMVALAPCMPEEPRSDALKEAVRAAGQCDGQQRADALVALAPHLPANLLRDALALVKTCEPDYFRAEALETLGMRLPPNLVPDALSAARDIANDWGRYRALSGLLTVLADNEYQAVLNQTLAAGLAIGNLNARAEAIAALAPRLEAGVRVDAVGQASRAAETIEWDFNRGLALATLTPELPPNDRLPVLLKALDALEPHLPIDVCRVVREAAAPGQQGDAAPLFLRMLREWKLNTGRWAFVDDASMRGYVGATFFANLALAMPPDIQGETIAQALAAAEKIFEPKTRGKALAAVTAAWKPRLEARPGDAYSSITALLHAWSNQLRAQLLRDIAVFTPALVTLGGTDTAVSMARAIQEVGRWWP
jgi:hypothetical protein